jgi:hypothetical protein
MPKKKKSLKSMKHIVDIKKINIDENIRKQLQKALSSLHEDSLQHENQHKLQRINKKNKTWLV